MSTRCLIGKKRKRYHVIYSHWDGYPEKPGVGWTLKKYYTNPSKINKLIDLGGISSLGAEIGRKHDFNDYDTAILRNNHGKKTKMSHMQQTDAQIQ